ncbi:MAG: carboxypeptidase-like regulatory domain-containing protein [Bacteroidales bacterium]|nr:carboxypeptidase-like regulatory domain-containing protein [Bacteroidales bacterium]
MPSCTPPITSQYVYAELINPLDSVVARVKVRADNGAFSGHIELDQVLPEGDYTLRAYTENMLNPGADYYFRKRLRVEGPFSATVNTKVTFRYEKGDRMTAEVSFEDIRSRKKMVPDGLRMRINEQPLAEVRTDDDTISRYTFRLAAESDRRVLCVETAKSSENIHVPYPQYDYEVYFFPEGGNLPAGARSAIAFKTLKADGMPAVVTGHILDSAGNIYARLETAHDGMGKFYMAADEAVKYYALCTNEQGLEKRFELPPARRNAYSLKTQTVADSLFISVLRSADNEIPPELILVLHTRGIIHYAEPWDNDFSKVSFDRRDFPSGILQAILFNAEMNPLSERLVFCLNEDQAIAELSTNHQNYEKRQPVYADVQITGPDGLPRRGNFSVSVTDDNDIKQDSSANILTSLLLTSDLKGHINNPAFYLSKDNPMAEYTLDLLMMTNGWRRYNIPEVMAGQYQKLKFPAKTGIEITGRVRTLITGRPVEKAEVAAFSWGSGYFDQTVTDSTGRFAFSAIEFQDSTEFILQALNKKGKPGVELVIDSDMFPPVTVLPVAADAGIEASADEAQVSGYITKADTKYTMDNGMRTIDIEEVVITAKAPENKKYSFSYYMPKVSQPSHNVLDYDQIEELHPTLTSELIYQIPFTRVEGGKVIIERMKFGLNGTVYAVLIIDDMIIHEYNIDDIDPYSIERIAVLKGGQAAMLGGAGAGGAIVITTRKGADIYKEVPKFNIRTVTPLGYQSPSEFYSPRYDTQEERESGPPDLRTTIFWNPNVAVSADGQAAFDFFTADTPSEYTVLIEGITSDGLILHSKNRISRR